MWWHRREWQRSTDINLSYCCLPVTCRSPAMNWDSNQNWGVNRLERSAGPFLPFRSWDDNFSWVCVGSRASFLYLDFRKGIAVGQRALSFLISVNDKESSPMHLPVSQWGNVSSPLSPTVSQKDGFRDFLPCHPCSREQILEASPRSTLLCAMFLLFKNDFCGDKIKQPSRCSFVAVSMVNPEVFWSKHTEGLSDC